MYTQSKPEAPQMTPGYCRRNRQMLVSISTNNSNMRSQCWLAASCNREHAVNSRLKACRKANCMPDCMPFKGTKSMTQDDEAAQKQRIRGQVLTLPSLSPHWYHTGSVARPLLGL